MSNYREIEQFHNMELKYGLFEIRDEFGLPVWDLLRVNIYLYFIQKRASLDTNSNKLAFIKKVINIIKSAFCSVLFSKRCSVLIAYLPRFKDENNLNYDKVAESMIDFCANKGLKILNLSYDFSKSRHKQVSMFPFDVYYHYKKRICHFYFFFIQKLY